MKVSELVTQAIKNSLLSYLVNKWTFKGIKKKRGKERTIHDSLQISENKKVLKLKLRQCMVSK